jgi:putative adhesin
MKIVFLKTTLAAMCALALAWAGDSNRYREDFHYSYPQGAGGRLALENFNGSVEIAGWDQNTVDISGTKYAESQQLLSAIRIEVANSGNAVRVRTTRPDPQHGNSGAKYVIRVPRRTELEDVHSSNGSLRVEDIEGNMHLATSNGSVHLARIRGDVDARSSNGSAEVQDVKGSVNFRTSNGGVHGENVEGSFDAQTSNGGIRVHLRDPEAGRPIRLATSNGGIDLQVDAPRQNDVVASTSNGPITVRLPSGVSGSVHASTNSNGSVRSDFDILIHGGEISRHRMDGAIGGGGPRIDLSTSNGNISLLRI